MPRIIHIHHRIIPTISKQIAKRGGFQIIDIISIDETAGFGVVVSALQIVEPGVGIIVVVSIPERDVQILRVIYTDRDAVCVIGQMSYFCSGGIPQRDDVSFKK